MRLIDADALLIEHANNGGMVSFVLRCVIDSAPTIEPPVVRGEWLKKETESETLAICNQCKYPVSWWHKSNYCPSCGAKMEETE